MDMRDTWERALKHTEIIRPRIQSLPTFEATQLPYIFLGESRVNAGDTVVRKGSVLVEKPAIILPSDLPRFEGFDSEEQSQMNLNMLTDFLLVRGVRFPSLKYNNKTESLDIREGKLQSAIDYYSRQLQQEENIATGLVIGLEDCWQFSILIFICTAVSRSAENDIRKLWDQYRDHEKP